MCKTIIIQASSRTNGNTQKVVDYMASLGEYDVERLLDYNIGHYDYDFRNREDDFRQLFKKIAENYETIVFATPIYWYTMSGLLKVFLDRISDFLTEEKDFGRKLRGKNMAVISCGSDDELFEGFLMPFEKTAEYLGMQFVGHLHTWVKGSQISEEERMKIERFSEKMRLVSIEPINNKQ